MGTQSQALTPSSAPYRTPPREDEGIDRSTVLTFSFDGTVHRAYPGDTIASALAAAGIRLFSRSFKYHRPRGLLCCAGHCPNCTVRVDDEPNVRACRRPVQEGMTVRSQNAWPSLKHDVLSFSQMVARFLPVGFYYKTFIRPRFLWPFFERVLRGAAGLGETSPDPSPGEFSKQHLHADVAVIGGGPAGMGAALAAAEQSARVLLFDDNPTLGGHLRFSAPEPGPSPLPDLVSALDGQPNVRVFTGTPVLGWYKDNWLSAARGQRLFKIRARSLVVATGAYETPLVFENNDLPGVMLSSAVSRLLHLFSVVPGKRAVIVTANDDGWAVAADLHTAGVTVAAVVDERDSASCSSPGRERLVSSGVPAFYRHTILAARGSGEVRGAVIAPIDGLDGVDAEAARSLGCDLLVTSVGWSPNLGLVHMAGGGSIYNEERAENLPSALPPGLRVAGRAAGTHDVETQVLEGRLAGSEAAASIGLGVPMEAGKTALLKERKAAEARRTSPRVAVPGGGKRFVCYCEDVTDRDLETAIAEGYESIELLKRYSTVSMGPCQGKMCSGNAVHLRARAVGRTVQETGSTTSRPPITPVTLGALAGQNLEPVQVTPIHDWHVKRGAKLAVAGLWRRAEHFGDPTAEVRAVRERVGLMDVSTLGKLQLTGAGVPDLLERIYANRWRRLDVGRVRYGVMCSEEGVVIDDGVCARMEDRAWYMSTTSSGATAVFEWIQWWLQSGWGEGVHLTDLTDALSACNLAGPRAREVLQAMTDCDLSNTAFPYMHIRATEVAGVPCRLLRIGFTGELSYEIHCPSAYGLHLWEALMAAGERLGIQPFGLEAQRVLRLEKAHIIVGQDTDATSDPISADLEWALKLEKPDFLGKRSLMRIQREGPRQRLVGFRMARPDRVPDEGLQVVRTRQDGKLDIIGWVTSSRFSHTLGEAIGLCWLPAPLAGQNEASFTIRLNGNLEEARVHHGAFYDPEGKRLRM